MNSLKLNEWTKQAGYTLPLFIVARIVGKHPNYLTALWKSDPERVKKYIADAEHDFKGICRKETK